MNTKKFLVKHDLKKPNSTSKQFVVPVNENGNYVLKEIEGNKTWDSGRVVFIGIEIDENEVMNRMEKNGKVIQNKPEYKSVLTDYFNLINQFKIGQAVKLIATEQGFSFEQVSVPKRTFGGASN
ncbi:MAG: hypothetical protein HUJ25_00105 [Crocinitomicaceae bacterium]|nr:hypothetical protein [Crocinitomicaceae bacterium]